MTEFPEAGRIADMVDQEKGATPPAGSGKKLSREDKKAAKKKAKRQLKGKGKGKMLPDPDDLEEADDMTETIDPPCSDSHFNQWLKNGSKSKRECELDCIQISYPLFKISTGRFYCHSPTCLCRWRAITLCGDR